MEPSTDVPKHMEEIVQQLEFVWVSSAETRGENISGSLITSKEALFSLMQTIEEEFDLDLVAHGCQVSPHGGATQCLGILDAGHISLYAWPKESVLLFDLLTEEEAVGIDDMERLARIFKQESPTNMIVNEHFNFGLDSTWEIRLRGDREEVADYDLYMEDPSDLKQAVASVQSKFQQIDVVDFYDKDSVASLKDALTKDVDYVQKNPRLFLPDRTLFLDGVVQSTRHGNSAYHESLVQPAMFAHDNPKRVAIIGGGECATLREVLKHNTIEKVIMIEIDEVIVEASKQFLPDWNDCSNFEGSSRYCMDDGRAEMFHEDAFKWFIDRFGVNSSEEEAPFDVIILDALDPQNVVDFAEALYGDSSFMGALYNGLSENGVLVSQVGEAVKLTAPAQTYSVNRNRALFIKSLIGQGFVDIAEYNEGGAMFEAPWTFNVAFKSTKSRNNWDDNEALVNLKMKKRAIDTLDGESPFEYFDGADMQARWPSKASEVVFCRQEPTPAGCEGGHGFDPLRPNMRRTMGSCSWDLDGDGGPYAMLESAVHKFAIGAKTSTTIEQIRKREVLNGLPSQFFDSLQKTNSGKTAGTGASYDRIGRNATSSPDHLDDGRSYIYNPAFRRNPSCYMT
eukprot:CAMPEP_0116996284 /NCGR_PEP_ID=MMETSP0472-20121206/143_1 /TAXON_ID=693140 ORGANISM="Tiarina fusus, Strain LIS" /NCGR_SAMPLE_ID=MMETSP0472 /ASSEMBLY_ACC=CAM_ASM_000603 /LENGTH=622 /DNA_ID=CAMNT_0004694857 /DNA_START=326 /DNA_END=2194 /DNA_ORIENTATION=+